MKYLPVILPFLFCLFSCRDNKHTPDIEKIPLSRIRVPKPEEEYLAAAKIRYSEWDERFRQKFWYNCDGQCVKETSMWSNVSFCYDSNKMLTMSISRVCLFNQVSHLYYNDWLHHRLYVLKISFPSRDKEPQIYSLTEYLYDQQGLIHSSISHTSNLLGFNTFQYNEDKRLISHIGFTYELKGLYMPTLMNWGTTDITYHYHQNVLDSIVYNGRKLPTDQSKFVQVCDAEGIVIAIINDHGKTMVKNYTAIPETEDTTQFRSTY